MPPRPSHTTLYFVLVRISQGSKPGPRTQTKYEAKDSPSENRHFQGQEPRTQAKVFSQTKKGLQKFFSGNLQEKKVFKNFFQALSTKNGLEKNFSADLQNFNHSKNSAVLEPRTGQFSRTWGFKAKDLTFEAKAKDFKMCPRGQGRSRGLHLCWMVSIKKNLN